MRVLYKVPGTPSFRQLLVPNDLHTLQDLVGGYIETVTAGVDPDVVLIVNEEGAIRKDVEYNCVIRCKDSRGAFDCPIFGPILMVGVDGEEFADCPISVVMANNMIVRED